MSGSGSHWWNLDQMNYETDVFYFKIELMFYSLFLRFENNQQIVEHELIYKYK